MPSIAVKDQDIVSARSRRRAEPIEVFDITYAKTVVGKAYKRSREEYITVKIVLEIPAQVIRALKYNYRRDFLFTVVDCSYCCHKLSIIWIGIIYSFAVEGNVDSIASNYPNLKVAFVEIRYITILHAELFFTPIELCKISLDVVHNICG
jgi:hypothetical protein